MTSQMTHWERVQAALKGAEVDRPPISLWQHWPVDDETPQGLTAVSLKWQQDYDFDLLKFMPTGTYGIEDWGAETVYRPNANGTRTIVKFGVTKAAQWPQLEQLDVTKNYLGRQIDALKLTAGALQNSVPILQTVFSPLTTARKLAGDRIFTDMRLRPEQFKAGLQIIAETTARFALESLRAGAHGLFFATQNASYRLMSEAEYREFGQQFDLIILNAVQNEAQFNMAHVHGTDIMFKLLAEYPVQAINWHDRLTWPSLSEARKYFSGMLVGGVDEWHTLLDGPVEAIQAEAQDAITQTGGRGFMLGPGCVLPINAPRVHLRAVREAVG